MGLCCTPNLLFLYLFLASAAVFTCLPAVTSAAALPEPHRHRRLLVLLEDEEEDSVTVAQVTQPVKKQDNSNKKSSSGSGKNQTKLIKPVSSLLKNKTKAIVKSGADSNSSLEKIKLKKINSTTSAKIKAIKSVTELPSAKSAIKKQNSTSKATAFSSDAKKSSDPLKSTAGAKIKPPPKDESKKKALSPPTRLYSADEDDDLVSDFRDLPTKFQKTIIPDLRRISSSSQIYFSKANKEMTKGVKPYVGNKYATSIATAISCAFIIIPFLLVSLLFNKIKAYFSLQKLLIFVQIYLSIYFTILSLSSLVTGLEPLKFFYATSQSTYIWLQVLQTLGYVLYLLLLLMYLILVFSTDCGLGSKFLGLAQTFVGFAVGLHYYMTVFHRVVLRQPPKTSWKVHGVYATCFLVICLLASADRRKKAYLGEGGDEGKKS